MIGSGRAIGGTESVLLDSAARLEAAGARVARVPEARAPWDGLLPMARRIRERAPHIVHVHLSWPHANAWLPAAARLAGAGAVVATEHLLFPETHKRNDLEKRLLAPLLDRTIAVSEGIARRLVERWGYRPSRVVVIPNGVALDAFPGPSPEARARGRRALGLDDRTPLVGSVGRLEAQKGFGHLVRAGARLAARFPKLRVAVAGEGSLAPALEGEARASGLGERLLLPGRIDAVPDFLAALDAFALPSLWEGMPLSLLEAMAMGAPCVATATPGAIEILAGPDALGMTVPPGDEEALATAIGALLEDRGRARALGLAARARVAERHDAARLFERLVAVYDDVAPRGTP